MQACQELLIVVNSHGILDQQLKHHQMHFLNIMIIMILINCNYLYFIELLSYY
jgi:hypothetical protein